jgi:hypothetical protein
MKQPIRCIMRPDPSTLFAIPTPLPLPRNPRSPPLSWTENKCPEVIVRGTIFREVRVEVVCEVSSKDHLPKSLTKYLISPAHYPGNLVLHLGLPTPDFLRLPTQLATKYHFLSS